MWQQPERFVIGCLCVFTASSCCWGIAARWYYILRRCHMDGVWLYLHRPHQAYRRKFLILFPDALDSIVRSVRAGYPLNPPLRWWATIRQRAGPEFKRVADEAAYGWTLQEALARLNERISEPD